MASVHDVVAAILSRTGSITTMKLQKLTYYVQAVSLVRTDAPMFDARIEAWKNGPVVEALYQEHRRRRTVAQWPLGDASRLTAAQLAVIDEALSLYGDFDGDWLSKQSHLDAPWVSARDGLADDEYSTREIPLDAMRAFYSRVLDDQLMNGPEPDAADWLSTDDLAERCRELIER